jgi:hypothetical protein
MKRVATVLYEDRMRPNADGVFPPHDFVLAMVGDLTGDPVWELRRQIPANPRNGVGNILRDIERTSLLAGAGKLLVLVDSDRFAEQLGLNRKASRDAILDQVRKRCDAPEKLVVCFVDPNMEGLLKSIAECEPGLPAPSTKDLNERDIRLKAATAPTHKAVRDCVRDKQPSLADLVDQIANLCLNTAA